MQNIVINGFEIPCNESGLFRLENVFEALNTERFINTFTTSARDSLLPHKYLASDQARAIAKAVVDKGNTAFFVNEKPQGGSFVCRELLLDYARRRDAELFVDLIGRFIDPQPVQDASNAPSKEDFDFLNLFFDAFFDLNDTLDDGLNHSHDPLYTAINLSQVTKVLKQNGVEMPYRKDIVRILKLDPMYDGNRSIKSKVWGHNAWCFLFKRSQEKLQ